MNKLILTSFFVIFSNVGGAQEIKEKMIVTFTSLRLKSAHVMGEASVKIKKVSSVMKMELIYASSTDVGVEV